MKKPDPQRKPLLSETKWRSPLEAERRRSGMRAVGALVHPIAKPALSRKPRLAIQIILDWPDIVGPHLAQLSSPKKLSGGTLTIACAGPAATEMQYLVPQLLERISAIASGRTTSTETAQPSPLRFNDHEKVVQRIRIVHDDVNYPSTQKPFRPQSQPISLAEGLAPPLEDILSRLGGLVKARAGKGPSS